MSESLNCTTEDIEALRKEILLRIDEIANKVLADNNAKHKATMLRLDSEGQAEEGLGPVTHLEGDCQERVTVYCPNGCNQVGARSFEPWAICAACGSIMRATSEDLYDSALLRAGHAE